ncbi:MAG: hypothetical protein ABIP16_01900 [Thermomonas sp.]
MSHRNRMLFGAIALMFGMGLGASADAQAQTKAKAKTQKKLYCWNQNGRKICSDALPAEAANAARTEISTRSGLATGQITRALTDNERTAAAVTTAVARRQAEAEAIRERRDLAMVESYVTEADLRRAYGERTSLLDETLKASLLGLSNLRLSLITLLRQAGDWELDHKPVPKQLAQSILQQHNDLIRQQQILAEQQYDRTTLDAEMTDAVRRYRTLKAADTSSSESAGVQPSPAG